MQKRDAPSKTVQVSALLIVIAATSTIFGCRGEKAAEPVQAAPAAVASAPASDTRLRSKEQAMAALMALPELKAWSSQLEKASAGKLRGALIEDDPQPKLVNGKRYYQLSFVENGSDAAHRWESFLVADSGDEILVEDFAADKTLTLDQWRTAKRPLARSSAN
jgi:hypothetical protein